VGGDLRLFILRQISILNHAITAEFANTGKTPDYRRTESVIFEKYHNSLKRNT